MQPIYVQALLYADDIVLITETKEELQNSINKWAEEITKTGMTLNIGKSKVMRVSKNEREEELVIEYNNERLEEVNNYTYLGVEISKDGKIEEEINNRIRKANNIYYQINNTVLGKKEMPNKTKLQVYKTTILPTITYGAESWVVNTKIESRITATEMKCLRKIAGRTRKDKIRNTVIREEVDIAPATEIIERKALNG